MEVLEVLMNQANSGMPEYQLNRNIKAKPIFGSGGKKRVEETLNRYKSRRKDVPILIWLDPYRPDYDGYSGLYEAQITLNLCCAETRTQTDIEHFSEDKAYHKILFPLWEDFQKQLWLTHRFVILDEGIQPQVLPDYMENNLRVLGRKYDIYRIVFQARWQADSKCHKNYHNA